MEWEFVAVNRALYWARREQRRCRQVLVLARWEFVYSYLTAERPWSVAERQEAREVVCSELNEWSLASELEFRTWELVARWYPFFARRTNRRPEWIAPPLHHLEIEGEPS